MAINISLVVKGPQVSLSNVVLHAIGETTEGEFDKLKCTEKYEDCFTGKGCRCWKSNLVVCSECKRDAYMCEKTNVKKDHCGWFELTMQNDGIFTGHKKGCSKNVAVHQ
jgi:hypothetical protein